MSEAFQLRPLSFLRTVDGLGITPVLDGSGEIIYGLSQYLSADRFFIFFRNRHGKWGLSTTRSLLTTPPTNMSVYDTAVMIKLEENGIFGAKFDRRKDLLEALETVLEQEES